MTEVSENPTLREHDDVWLLRIKIPCLTRRGYVMADERHYVQTLEKRNRFLMGINVLLVVFGVLNIIMLRWTPKMVAAQDRQKPQSLIVSEVSVVDENGVVRARIGGKLPDAVVDGKVRPRGDSAAGVILYDETGQERSGYVTFGSGNVGLTLDNRSGQTAEFVAGPQAGSVMRLHWHDGAVELRTDEDGPTVHVVKGNRVLFHEPPVEHPETTELCKALRESKAKLSKDQLMNACLARSSEAGCKVCLGN
jgi:hypothetical protein